MPEIKKILIKKRSYKFELRKKFFNKKKFRIIVKPPIAFIAEEIKKSLFPKRTESTGISPLLLFFVLIIGILIFAYISSLFSQQALPTTELNQTFKMPLLNMSIKESGVASLGARVANERTAYYILNLSASDTDSLEVQTAIYNAHVPNQVFILVSKRTEAMIYPEFESTLKKLLNTKGFALNKISLEQLETLPKGALLIVPSGLIPEKLVQNNSAHILKLLGRGVNIIYIGKNFDFYISEDGRSKKTPAQELLTLPFSFESTYPIGTLLLSSSLYKVRGTSTSLFYGVISGVKIGNGAILFVPQTLDGGWNKKSEDAATDIERIITEMKWIEPQAEQKTIVDINRSKELQSFFFSPVFSEREKTVVVRVIASNQAGKTEKIAVFYPNSDVNGDIFYMGEQNKTVSAKITGESTIFFVYLNENTSEKRKLFFSIKDANNKEAQQKHLIYSEDVELAGELQFSEKLNMGSGVYLASIIDTANNSYAKAIIEITNIEFLADKIDFAQNNFSFKAFADSRPAIIKKLNIIIDEQYSYLFFDSSQFKINLNEKLNGVLLPVGNHTFDFEYGELKTRIVIPRVVSVQWYENPFYWVGFILVGVLFVCTPYLAAFARKIEYALDIPDFPPLASIKIPIKKDVVFNIIEKVNEVYKWKNTPLTLEEIKNGFKKIIYQSKSVFISDYNLEFILEKLKNNGEIKSALDYYGLAKWTQETNKSMVYLAMQRKIRDICVNEAAPFIKKNNAECDVVITVLGQEVFVYIMDTPTTQEQKLSYVLKTIKKGLAVLLFEGAEQKGDFENLLNSVSESSGIIKMEIIAGSVNLLTLGEFEKMIKEMKNTVSF